MSKRTLSISVHIILYVYSRAQYTERVSLLEYLGFILELECRGRSFETVGRVTPDPDRGSAAPKWGW